MRYGKTILIAVLIMASTPDTSAQTKTHEADADALFAQWDKPETPGCAVGVYRDGEIIFAKGYGLAQLEYDIPITPRTVFHVASVSKQFTDFAIAMLAVRALFEVGPPPPCRLAMLWTSDEETGSVASEASILEQAAQSDAVLVLEPSGPQGALKTSRKGCGQFEMVVTGVAAHAGIEPERGCSAVHELARQIVSLESLHDPESGVTVNVGQVRGGTRP
ncbi:MAG: serine hydrolase, partial [Planctomycetes bacterium]|nr:serine hydrolase [Planctomycetota bacterium]